MLYEKFIKILRKIEFNGLVGLFMSTPQPNKLNDIRVAKLCININPGSVGDQVTRASRVIEQLTKQKAMLARSHRTIPKFGIRRNDKIAAFVTVRGQQALSILDKALQVHDFEISNRCFSSSGNFGFGIKEHIDLGLKYDRQELALSNVLQDKKQWIGTYRNSKEQFLNKTDGHFIIIFTNIIFHIL